MGRDVSAASLAFAIISTYVIVGISDPASPFLTYWYLPALQGIMVGASISYLTEGRVYVLVQKIRGKNTGEWGQPYEDF